MAYEKQSWKTGDIITQQKMNHIEDGIVNNEPMIIHLIQQDENTFRYDKTWQEMYDAIASGRPVYEMETQSTPHIQDVPVGVLKYAHFQLITVNQDTQNYNAIGKRMFNCTCSNPTDYPTYIKKEDHNIS